MEQICIVKNGDIMAVLFDKFGNGITWLDAIIKSLKIIGHPATVKEIYEVMKRDVIREVPKSAKTPTQTIYGQIYTHSNDSKAGAGKKHIFYSESRDKGTWGLVDNRAPAISDNMEDGYDEEAEEFPEGKILFRIHRSRERNPHLIKEAKGRFKAKHDNRIFCEICGFDFGAVYGEIGKDFIEAHHIKPVSEMQDGDKSRVEDMVMLCSNCHRMIHRIRPWISDRKDLKKIVQI